jgi:myo-inositol 2-dehydrogenase / D-chiro-inositol 1-dehydrogenase
MPCNKGLAQMSALRFGIVGAGMMAREHIRNLKLVDDVEIAALADPVESSLTTSVVEIGHSVATFPDAASMVQRMKLDAVIVSSPNFTHRAVLEPLFASGCHILCEKPLCTTIPDARWVVEQAAASASVFWTAMEYRFMPPAAAFIADIHSGAIGRLVMLTIREHRFPFLVKVGDWNRFNRNTGGTMVEKCCHFFDLMRVIVRSEPVSVFCSGAMDVNHLDERYDGQRPDIIDNSFTVVDFANGVRAMLDLSMFAEGSEEQEALTAVGDMAKLEAFIPSGDLVHSPRTPLGEPKRAVRRHVAVDQAALAAGTHHGSVYYQLLAFLDAVRGRGPVHVTAEDGLRSVAIGAAAEISAREKRVVAMSELGFPHHS